MKASLIAATKILLLPALLVAWFCLCALFPGAVTAVFEAIGTLFIFTLIAAPVLGSLLAGLAAAFSLKHPPANTPAAQSSGTRPRARYPCPAPRRSRSRLLARWRPE